MSMICSQAVSAYAIVGKPFVAHYICQDKIRILSMYTYKLKKIQVHLHIASNYLQEDRTVCVIVLQADTVGQRMMWLNILACG